MLKRLTLLCSLGLLTACQTDNVSDSDGNVTATTVTAEKKSTKSIEVTKEPIREVNQWQQGELVFMQFESGFYGIISATGEKLLPLNLSEAYYQAGAKIRFKAEKASIETIQQWGTPVTILAIELIAQAESKNSTH
jgi:hypothetical protein